MCIHGSNYGSRMWIIRTQQTRRQQTKASVQQRQHAGDAGTVSDTTGDDGKVLNIYCWNEEFKSRLEDHYPGYEEVDATTWNHR